MQVQLKGATIYFFHTKVKIDKEKDLKVARELKG
jgi:hypothetical protein